MTKIFDMFCSNGSTWFDKDYFNNKTIKNDKREGEFDIYGQKIIIKPDFQIDVFNTIINDEYRNLADLVYMDPPHLKYNSTGIMVKKYTTLPLNWKEALDIMFQNARTIAPLAILKWNDIHFDVNIVLEIAKKYFHIGFGNRNKKATTSSYFILLIRKEDQ